MMNFSSPPEFIQVTGIHITRCILGGGFMKKNKIHIQRFGIPIERKGKNWFKLILYIVFLFGVLCAVTIGVQNFIQRSIENLAVTNDLNATWLGSLASYWGGIIGGIISGSLTVIGVAWTIKYYRDSDLIKSRVERMPFLMAEVKGYTDEKSAGSVTCGVNIYEINSKAINADTSKGKTLYYRIRLRNIGQGFASTLVIYTGKNFGGMAYNTLIQVDDSGEFCFEIHARKNICGDEINFGVRYIDCMTNEYTQLYTIQWEGENLSDTKVENGYPNFICQTHAIGK